MGKTLFQIKVLLVLNIINTGKYQGITTTQNTLSTFIDYLELAAGGNILDGQVLGHPFPGDSILTQS